GTRARKTSSAATTTLRGVSTALMPIVPHWDRRPEVPGEAGPRRMAASRLRPAFEARPITREDGRKRPYVGRAPQADGIGGGWRYLRSFARHREQALRAQHQYSRHQ